MKRSNSPTHFLQCVKTPITSVASGADRNNKNKINGRCEAPLFCEPMFVCFLLSSVLISFIGVGLPWISGEVDFSACPAYSTANVLVVTEFLRARCVLC